MKLIRKLKQVPKHWQFISFSMSANDNSVPWDVMLQIKKDLEAGRIEWLPDDKG